MHERAVLRSPRGRGARFSLTPLKDVIFLLLMFFMLSSSFAPFGLLDVSSVAEDGGEEAADSVAPAARIVSGATLRISRGHVTAGRQTIALDELPDAIAALAASGIDSVTLLTTRSARVQDVVTTLEAFKVARFPNVAMINRLEQR